MRFVNGCAATVAALAAATAPAADLTFAEALDLLRAGNETVLAARAEVTEKREEKAATASLSLPRVALSGEMVRIDDPFDIDLDPIREAMLKLHPGVPASAVPHFRLRLLDENFFRSNVHATLPLYTGGKIAAAKGAAAAGVQAAEAQAREAEERSAADLARRYFALRLAHRAVAVRTEVLTGMDEHLRQARRLEEEGMIARAERLHAEVARAEAERQLRKAQRDAELASLALANLLATDDAAPGAASPLFMLSRVPDVDALRGRALESNPALARIAAQRALAREGTRVATAAYYPDVAAFAARQLYTPDLMPIEPTWYLGIGFRIELFDGSARSHRVAAAEARERRVALLERRVRRDLATLVEKRHREATTAREQFETLATTRALVAEGLQVRTRAFEEGLGTSLEVVDARLAVARVELERLAAAYEFDVALAELYEAAGCGEQFAAAQAQADVEVER